MGKRWTWVAWSLLAVYLVSMVAATILAAANGTFQQDAANQTLLFLGFGAFMAVGALIVAHRPGNAIGWLFSAIALLAFTGQLASEYATYAYVTQPGSLPGGVLAAWYGSWPWWLVLALALVFTPLLFPTGRLLSPGWRPVAWLAGAATAALAMLAAFMANLGTIGGQVIANPIGLAWVGDPEKGTVGAAFCAALQTATGGNPLFVGAVLDAVAREGTSPTAEHAARLLEIGAQGVARARAGGPLPRPARIGHRWLARAGLATQAARTRRGSRRGDRGPG